MVTPGARRSSFAVLLLAFLGLVGCKHSQTRLQSDDEGERDKELIVRTIGDVTDVANGQPIPVTGVGLVVGLQGTGGKPVADGYRSMLEDQLRKQKYEHIREILESPTTSVVLVSALVPAGALKDDPLDVEITLPPQSKTTSLAGGYLKHTLLWNTDSAHHLNPKYAGADRGLRGHALASASGPIIVGFGEGDEAARTRQGRIWGGGKSKIDRSFFLTLKENQQLAPLSQRVADRINETMQGSFHGVNSQLATPKDNKLIVLRVPEQYKHNLPRYLRVVRLIPIPERPEVLSKYKSHLGELLLDPKKTVIAALRMEALGTAGTDAFKEGLKSEHALVRFCSAESLAYLGNPVCGEELARMVEQQPALRAFSLTALASMDEAVSHVKLRELLSSTSAEARYGAFRALRALDERDPSVAGEQHNDSFWVHRVAPQSSALVHLSYSRRPEVVLFGEEVYLQPPFSFLSGEFTMTANKDDDRCTICRLSVRHGTSRKQCSLALHEVLRTLGEMGGAYPQVVDFMKQADSCQSMTCQLAVDALPQATSVYYLAKHGAKDPDFEKADDEEIRSARGDFLSTPALFDKNGGRRQSMLKNDESALLNDRKTKSEKQTAERK